MQGLLFETDSGVRYILRALVVLLGFWTAWRTGRSVADGWGDFPRVVIYTLALGLVMRFLHFALFNGPFINGFYYVFDVVLLLAFPASVSACAGRARWSITTIGSTIGRRHFHIKERLTAGFLRLHDTRVVERFLFG